MRIIRGKLENLLREAKVISCPPSGSSAAAPMEKFVVVERTAGGDLQVREPEGWEDSMSVPTIP